jgi:hypothetical protein
MALKYLETLNKKEKDNLIKRLHAAQNCKCFICQKEIDLKLHTTTNIDHIIPLKEGGKDEENNFGLTHESCNKSKQADNLEVARSLQLLKEIKETCAQNNKSASLEDVLTYFGGAKFDFSYSVDGNMLKYTFNELNDVKIYTAPIFIDSLSKEKTAFIELPIEYIYHDKLINPRGINSSISLLVKEFYLTNPQLHVSLARIEDGKVKVFDGQHKAVSQILLGVRKLLVRVFIEPNVERLIMTNTNAGSKLKQIAFDKSILNQLHDQLYADKIQQYRQEHGLNDDDYSFSEKSLIDHFKGVNMKKFIIDSVKNKYIKDDKNKLSEYIDIDGKSKTKPISSSTFEKVFNKLFINTNKFFEEPLNDKCDVGENPRAIQKEQLIKLCNIIAEELYIQRFDLEKGDYNVEDRVKKNDGTITDKHLVAHRLSREPIMNNWLMYLKDAMITYCKLFGTRFKEEDLMFIKFDDKLWTNIRNFLINLRQLSAWKNRALSESVFAGKQNYSYWEKVFETGRTPEGTIVLQSALNWQDLIVEPQNKND